jgi:hypothetical protein
MIYIWNSHRLFTIAFVLPTSTPITSLRHSLPWPMLPRLLYLLRRLQSLVLALCQLRIYLGLRRHCFPCFPKWTTVASDAESPSGQGRKVWSCGFESSMRVSKLSSHTLVELLGLKTSSSGGCVGCCQGQHFEFEMASSLTACWINYYKQLQ